MKVDKRLMAQLAYHFCRLDCGKNTYLKRVQDMLEPLAKQFHRFDELEEK
jgi:hypothetical protein